MLREGSALATVLLAVGVALAGWFVGNGFVKGRTADRYVSVKGVSERDVVADMALWPIRKRRRSCELGFLGRTRLQARQVGWNLYAPGCVIWAMSRERISLSSHVGPMATTIAYQTWQPSWWGSRLILF